MRPGWGRASAMVATGLAVTTLFFALPEPSPARSIDARETASSGSVPMLWAPVAGAALPRVAPAALAAAPSPQPPAPARLPLPLPAPDTSTASPAPDTSSVSPVPGAPALAGVLAAPAPAAARGSPPGSSPPVTPAPSTPSSPVAPAATQAPGGWRIAWGEALADGVRLLPDDQEADLTCRFNARSTLSGDAIEVGLSNFGGQFFDQPGGWPLEVAGATVALRERGAAERGATVHALSFAGASPNPSVPLMVAAGRQVTSDPVGLSVGAGQDVAVTLYLTGAGLVLTDHYSSPSPDAAGHPWDTYVTNACARGDWLGDTSGTQGPWVSGGFADWFDALDVHTPSSAGSVAVLGDSLSSGYCTAMDSHAGWTDVLARRLASGGAALGVVNEAIGGNTLMWPAGADASADPGWSGQAGLLRVARDVLSAPGLRAVVVFLGTNDIWDNGQSPDPDFLGEMEHAYGEIADDIHAAGLEAIIATIPPRASPDGSWTPAMESQRLVLDDWIRGQVGAGRMFDALADFDAVLRSKGAGQPATLAPAYDCGDHTHPSVAGQQAMAASAAAVLG